MKCKEKTDNMWIKIHLDFTTIEIRWYNIAFNYLKKIYDCCVTNKTCRISEFHPQYIYYLKKKSNFGQGNYKKWEIIITFLEVV